MVEGSPLRLLRDCKVESYNRGSNI